MSNNTNRGKKFPANKRGPHPRGSVSLARGHHGQLSAGAPEPSDDRHPVPGRVAVGRALVLKPSDVDIERGELFVREGKGGKSRTVGLDDGALKLLAAWIERRQALGYSGHKPLFCAIKREGGGGPLATSDPRELLPELGKKAGLTRRVHPHGLRHSRAKELADAGVPAYLIRDALGHTAPCQAPTRTCNNRP